MKQLNKRSEDTDNVRIIENIKLNLIDNTFEYNQENYSILLINNENSSTYYSINEKLAITIISNIKRNSDNTVDTKNKYSIEYNDQLIGGYKNIKYKVYNDGKKYYINYNNKNII